MAIVFTNEGEKTLLTWMLDSTATPENLSLKLYSNDHTPTATDDGTAYTEATFTGYSAKTLSRGSWGTPSTSDGVASIAYSAAQTWDATSAQEIYGYYLVGGTSGALIGAEKFSTVRELAINDTLSVLPKITLDTASE